MVARSVIAIALVGCAHASSPPPPSTPACVAPAGDTVRWEAAVCEYRTGTDDFENEAVGACMKTLPANLANASDCEKKRAYKAEICKLAGLDDAKCASFVPAVVEHGVGGD